MAARCPALPLALLLALPLALAGAIDSQAAAPPAVRHHSWTADEGLPQSSVNALLQARDGYLWIGTFDGLVRFDGVRFTEVEAAPSADRGARSIAALAEDEDGALWIGTFGEGLVRWRSGGGQRFTKAEGLPSEDVQSLAADRRGGVWVGLHQSGLAHADARGARRIVTGTALDSTTPLVLLAGADGVLAGTPIGLAEVRAGRCRFLPGYEGQIVHALAYDRRGRLWVGTESGLYLDDGGSPRRFGKEHGLPVEHIDGLLGDADGRLWVSTHQRLAAGDENGFAAVELPGLAGGDGPRGLLLDHERSLWVGTGASGLHRLRQTQIGVVGTPEGLSTEVVQAVLPARDGSVLVATSCGGVDRIAGGVVTAVELGALNRCVWALHEARDGALWVGSYGGGLARIADGVVEIIDQRRGLPSDAVFAFAEDAGGGIWIGTLAGLAYWLQGRITTWPQGPGLAIHALATGRDGSLWIGTYGGGLARWRNGTFRFWGGGASGRPTHVRSILEDADGTLWIGTYGEGLARWRGGRFTQFRQIHGLPDDVVSAVVDDGAGALWLSTNRGIARLERSDLDSFAQGRVRSLSPVVYGVADGMRTRECNGGGQPTGVRTADGRLWFPTVRGVAIVDPGRRRERAAAPPVAIEEVLADGSALPMGSELRVPAGTDRLEIRYTGLSFVHPARVRFRYRLEGFDRSWVEVADSRLAVYTNVPPGRYVFRVAAANADGVWNKKGATLALTLAPRLAEHPMVWALGLAVLVAVVFWLLRVRLALLRAESAVIAERNRLAREIHDSLAQNFAGIKMQLRAMQMRLATDPQAAAAHLERAAGLAQRGLEEAGRSVWALKRQAMNPEELEVALADLGHDLGAAGIDYATHLSGAPRTLRGEAALAVLRIAEEAIANAGRHAGATRVETEVIFEQRRVRLRVSDDGGGFDTTAQRREREGGGAGLGHMRTRAEQLGGKLTVRSTPTGTDVELTLPARSSVAAGSSS